MDIISQRKLNKNFNKLRVTGQFTDSDFYVKNLNDAATDPILEGKETVKLLMESKNVLKEKMTNLIFSYIKAKPI